MQSGNINSNRSGGAIITRRSDEVTGRFALKKASEREHVQPTETGGRGKTSKTCQTCTIMLFDRCYRFVAIISCTPSPPFHAQNMRQVPQLTERNSQPMRCEEISLHSGAHRSPLETFTTARDYEVRGRIRSQTWESPEKVSRNMRQDARVL